MKTDTTTKIVTINAAGRPLGRVASEAAVALRGKDQPDFQRYLPGSAQVKIINIKQLKISLAKAAGKLYVRYSGYPGGQKLATQTEVLAKFGPGEVLRRAIRGMLPANKLRPILLKHLSFSD